jgi:release factor glutamine methyltransferase
MKLSEALLEGKQRLENAGFLEAFLESEILLRHVLGLDRIEVRLQSSRDLTKTAEFNFFRKIDQRLAAVPIAYIIGNKEFYGLDFYVDHRVLIPRPETEHVIEKTLDLAQNFNSPVIADIGTGSGIIAITLALNLSEAHIYASDVSLDALIVAQINANKHKVSNRIDFIQSNLLEDLPLNPDIIVANLPYVPTADLKPLKSEPTLALNGGFDGLDVIRELFDNLAKRQDHFKHMILEVGHNQVQTAKKIATLYYPCASIEIIEDLNSIARLLVISTSPV